MPAPDVDTSRPYRPYVTHLNRRHGTGQLARDRRARGLRLNYPEAVALITSWVLEAARDGRSVAELMAGDSGC